MEVFCSRGRSCLVQRLALLAQLRHRSPHCAAACGPHGYAASSICCKTASIRSWKWTSNSTSWGSQCRTSPHHLLDVLVGHTGIRVQRVIRLPSLVSSWGGEARIFKQSLEFQGDTDLIGDLLPQLRITAVLIVLKESRGPADDRCAASPASRRACPGARGVLSWRLLLTDSR